MSEATSPAMSADTHHGDDVDTRSIVIWGLVCVFITVITIGALHAMYTMYANEQRVTKSYNKEFGESASAVDQQAGALQQPIRWLDQQGKTVGVPIDKAMELVVNEYQSTPSN